MKRIDKIVLLAAAMIAAVSPTVLQAQTSTLVVANGTATNEYVPIYGYYADAFQHNQMIYPASMLTAMQGGYITQLGWQLSSTADDSWGISVTVSVGIVADSVLSGNLSTATVTPVWTGVVNGNAANLTIPFAVPFFYPGGHLLVDVKVVGAGDYSEALFYGIARVGSSIMVYDYDAVPASISGVDDGDYEVANFLPKATFDYSTGGEMCIPPVGVTVDSLSTDYARLTWVGDAQSYAVQWGETDGFVSGSGSMGYSVGNTISFTSLTPATSYTVLLWNECTSDNSDTVVFTFRTNATPVTSYPYSTGFESLLGDDMGWAFNNGTAVNVWVVDSAANNTPDGSYAMYISNDGGATNSYTNNATSTVYAYRPFMISETGEYVFSFDWRANAESCCDYLRAYVAPGTADMTAVSIGTSGWTELGGNLNGSTLWNTQSNVVNFTDTGLYYLVFKWANDYSTGSNPPAAVDNISVSPLSCPQPYNLTVSSVTADQVVLSWTPGDSETAWSLSINGGEWQVVNTLPFTVGGLTPGTHYTFRLRAVCMAGDTSLAATADVWTSCVALTELPYVQNFDGLTAGVSGSFDPCWSKGTSSSTSYPYVESYTTEPGYNNVLYAYNTSLTYCYAVMPEIDGSIDLTTLELSFDMRKRATGTSYGAYMVVAVLDTSVWAQGSPVDTIAVFDESSATFVTKYVSFANYTGTGRRIAFLFYANGHAYNSVNLDNISLHAASGCAMPSNLALAHATGDSLVLTWTGTGPDDDYWVEYRQANAADSVEWTGILVGDTSVAIDGLSPNTLYAVRVRSVCSATDSGNAVGGTFRTLCGAIVGLPWTENFDELTVTSGSMIPCWTHLGGGYVNTTSTYYHGGGNGLRFYPNGSTNGNVVVLPEFGEPTGNLEITLWSRPEGAASGSISVGYITNIASADSFVELANYPVSHWTSGNNVNTWLLLEQTFVGVPDSARIALRHNVSSASWYWFIDDIDVHLAPVCTRPSSVTVDNATCESVSVSALGPDGATYRFTIGQGTTIVDSADVTDPYYTFTGLLAQTAYTVSAAVICDDGTVTAAVSAVALTPACGDDLPYSTGFELGDDDSWTLVNGNQANKWTIGEATGNGGGRSLYISSDNGTSNTYNYYSESSVYAYKAFDFLPGQYQVAYDWRCDGEGSYDYMRVFIAPGTTVFSAGNTSGISATGAPAGWIAADGGNKLNLSSEWQSQESLVSIVDTMSAYVVFYWHNDNSAGSNPPAAIDNIEISSLNCPTPVNITLDSITANTAYLHWTPVGSETEWDVSVNGGSWQNSYTPSFVATGLTPSSYNTFSVRAVCGVGDTSVPATLGAYTQCLPINTLPYTQDFENLSTGSNSPFDPCWSKGTNASTAYPYVDSYTSEPGFDHVLHTYCYGNNYCYAVMPELDASIPLNTVELSFDMRRSVSAEYGSHMVVAALDTNVWSLGQPFDTIAVFDATDYTFVTKYVSFASYSGNAKRIAFLFFNVGSNYNYVQLDNIDLHAMPPCPRPSEPVVTYVGHDQISVSLAGSLTGNYIVYITSASGADSVTLVGDSTYTFTGLTPQTQYAISVASDCGFGVSPTQTVSVRTTSLASPLPYSTGFESGQDASWVMLNGSNAWCVGQATSNGGSNALYVSDDGGVSNSYSDNETYSMAYKTLNFDSVGDYVVSFDWKANGESYFDYLRVLLVPGMYEFVPNSDNGITETSIPAGWIALDGGQSLNLHTVWQNHTEPFTVATPSSYNLVFFWTNDDVYGANPPAAIDNVYVGRENCPSPVDITFDTIGSSTAMFHWTPGGTETEWLVSVGTGPAVVVGTPSYTASGLNSITSYVVAVRPICGEGDTGFAATASFYTGMCDNMVDVATGDPDSTTSTSYSIPVNNYYSYSFSETIVTAAEIGGQMDITGISYYYSSSAPSTMKNNVSIYLQPTVKSSFVGDADFVALNASAVKVYSGPLNCHHGWNDFGFTTPYTYLGTGNLLVVVVDSSGDYDGNTYAFLTQNCTDAMTIAAYSDNDNINPYSTTMSSSTYTDRYNARPVMRLVSCGGGCFEPVITSSTATDVSIAIEWFAGHDSCYVAITSGVWNDDMSGTLVTGTHSYSFTGLTPSTNYTVAVRQRCDDGVLSNWTLRQLITSDVPCSAVENINVSDVTSSGATIGWTPVGAETAWNVRVYNTVYDETFRSTAATYTVEGLTAGVAYNVDVQPICGSGADVDGPWTGSPVTFTTDVCQPVADVVVGGITGTSVSVGWTPSPGSNMWRVEYGTSGFSHGEQIASLDVVENPYTITGLEPGTMYDVYVATVCDGNLISAWSQPATFETSSDGIVNVDAGGDMSIYPNPVSGAFVVEWRETGSPCRIDIVDVNGRIAASADVNGTRAVFDASGMSKGAYFVRLTCEQTTIVRKLMVR